MKTSKTRTIEYTKTFTKQLRKQPAKIQIQTKKRILDWQAGRHPERLNDHKLTGEYVGYRSINITGDVRALYFVRDDGVVVVFAFIGSHAELY